MLYGNIESYRLTIEFVNKPYYHLFNYSILSTSKKYEIFTSNLNGYKDGGRLSYKIATCNTAGCSANTSKCALYIRGNLISLWNLYSVIYQLFSYIALLLFTLLRKLPLLSILLLLFLFSGLLLWLFWLLLLLL